MVSTQTSLSRHPSALNLPTLLSSAHRCCLQILRKCLSLHLWLAGMFQPQRRYPRLPPYLRPRQTLHPHNNKTSCNLERQDSFRSACFKTDTVIVSRGMERSSTVKVERMRIMHAGDLISPAQSPRNGRNSGASVWAVEYGDKLTLKLFKLSPRSAISRIEGFRRYISSSKSVA